MRHEEVEPQIVRGISKRLYDHNVLEKSIRMARDRYREKPESVFCLGLLTETSSDGRQYNKPTASEVAGFIIGELTDANFQHDVIVKRRKNDLQRITYLHPSFMAMNYPLIQPYGEDGYILGIQFMDLCNKSFAKNSLSMRQCYCFWIQRLNEGHTLLQAGRLLHQDIVDGYMAIEDERF